MSSRSETHLPQSYENFKALGGLTLCAEGDPIKIDDQDTFEYIPACIVYENVYSPHTANRERVTDSSLHRKVTLDGTPKEELLYVHNHRLMEALRYLYLARPGSQDRIIAVPTHEIDQTFDPRESLLQILYKKVPGIPEQVTAKVRKATQYMVGQGIPLSDIGIYGGLQTFMIHTGSTSLAPIKDIDLVIYGLEHLDHIKTLAEHNLKFKAPSKNTRAAHVDEEIRHRRHLLSRIYVPNDNDGLFCDIKMVRKEGDPNSFTTEWDRKKEDTTLTGVVVNAREALSSPASFILYVEGVGQVTIASSKYNFIAAVSEGDKIEIRVAVTQNDKYFMLTDPLIHYIKYLSTSKMGQ